MSESQAQIGFDRFSPNIEVASERTSEIDYEVHFRHVQNFEHATLEGISQQTTAEFDALFGSGNPLEETRLLTAGRQQLSVNAFIIDDFKAEGLECFTLTIVVIDTDIQYKNFRCNEFNNAVDFFCLHTVCIEDNDG